MFWSACIYWFVCMSVCMLPLFSKTTGPNCMKCSVMIYHHPRTNQLDFGSDQVEGQSQGHEKVKNYWTELHEIFRDDLSSSKDQSIRFCERSGKRSKSRSRKGQKCIFVITYSVFVRFIWIQLQNVHFSIPYPLVWWQMWRWQRYALYQVICMYVCMLPTFLKTTGPDCIKFSGMICRHPRTNRLDFESDQVKSQGQGHEKVKNVFLS